ncbi:Antithrombin-III [Dissostichus eleginoides]|uniref:Antithrombin-III n=1 Tax=Dissostichus eleginoides TaxID=100907 RepID=A0AAD9CAH7_DISEL|nr:Antithrombin-III [Dissostichus eleginoides]
MSKANGRFALALHKQLALSKSPEENIFMSPISISTAFAMTKLGACNETLRQIMELNCRLYRKKDETTALFSANRLFGDKSLVFDEMYQNISETMYGSKLLPLNFKEYPEEARGEWKNKFDKENVYKSVFHVSESRSCPVSQMYQETRFSETTLSQVEEGLDLKKLTHWMDRMEEKTVTVHIPRFRLEDSFSLKDKLQAMGLTDLFSSEKASLPGMLEEGVEGLHISDAFHKAFLEVNEEGSEAAAATGVVAVGRSINFDREVFQVNRPFLLLIREKSINALLFTARVADPCTQ